MRLAKRLRRRPYRLGAGLSLTRRGGQHLYPVQDGLLAWWKHDEGAGSTLYDVAGGLGGTIHGAGFWANKCPDGSPCGTYDGASNYVDGLGTGLAFNSGDKITITVAWWPDSVVDRGGSQWSPLGPFKFNSADTANYIFFQGNNHAGYEDQIGFAFQETGVGWHFVDTTDLNLVVDTWYILSVTFTFGTGSSLKLYNGTAQLSYGWASGDGDADPNGQSDEVLIGGNTLGDPAAWAFGRMGDVLLYDRALPITELTQNFTALRGRYNL